MNITLDGKVWRVSSNEGAPFGGTPSASVGDKVTPKVGDVVSFSYCNRNKMDASLAKLGLKIGKNWGPIESL